MDIFLTVLAILFGSLVINVVLKHFTIPPIIGYIVIGIAAKAFLDFDGHGTLSTFAEFGIVFLMFMLGLEFSVSHMIAMKREVFVLGPLQLFGVAVVIGAVCHFVFGLSHKEGMVVAFALALSSTAIVIKLLQESRNLHRNHGRVSLGVLLFQDLAVVPLLIMIAIFSDRSQSLDSLLWQTAFNSISVLAAIYFFGKYVVNYFLKFVSSARSNELFMSAVLLIVLSSAYLAHVFEISYSLGAFIAGMMLAESKYKYQIEADLTPFRDLFLGLFFLSVGLMVNLGYVVNRIGLIIAVTVAVMAFKTLVLYWIVRIFYAKRTAIKSALILSQVGEFSFVIFALARSNGILEDGVTQILIATVIISMVLTPFVARYVTPISYRFTDENKENEILQKTRHKNNHVVVIGFGNVGKRVVDKLVDLSIPYVAVEFKRDLVYDGQARGLDVVFGNATKIGILDNINMQHASVAIVTNEDEDDLLRICALISFRYPHVHLIARAKNKREYDMLTHGGRLAAIDQSDHISDMLIKKAMECKLEAKAG